MGIGPPEAWAPDRSVLERDGEIAHAADARIVEAHRRVAIEDVPLLAAACEALDLSSAAFANEGLAVHAPSPQVLARTLRAVRDSAPEPAGERQWCLVTNRRTTLSMLDDAGCRIAIVQRGADYLGSFPDEA
ncbi:hypothetical protein [Novosphingobium mangrovi (ex Huang et al. 2023)]|uniref:Uncharacterized protein n=1 Tax=Novosphingobium mangrovi (ex Huang et al. 2023) TaxID=2976432 RepID=A0ABT2I589_9SPHN|nr:hypothetical protein [Novosphingobium mangrovi (ex Huang et al. 2023)]MCT2399990.1 hypothetical protein [Novosphingobium mangrovi (ex Huang et al. 2023)]